jgi:plastocyanin
MRIAIAIAVPAALLAACGGGKQSSASKSVAVRAGVNDPSDPNVAALAFLPQEITVAAGFAVNWSFKGPEPHTVTFVPKGQQPPSPDSPEATAPKPPSGPYDGTSLVSSGILPTGPTAGAFSLSFAKTGTYGYVCAIHPGMTGTVNVVASGAATESREQIVARAKQEQAKWLAEGEAAKKALVSKAPKSKKNSNGTTTWYVQMGASTPHSAVLAFAPTPVQAKPGDSVVFVNDSAVPHTATFPGKQTVPANPESAEAKTSAPGKSPQTLNSIDLFNSGWLPPNAPPGAAPPESARSFQFNIPKAGQYTYVCLLHAPSGMAGTITVS